MVFISSISTLVGPSIHNLCSKNNIRQANIARNSRQEYSIYLGLVA